MNNIKNIDFKKSTQLQKLSEILKSTNNIGDYVLNNISEMASNLSIDNGGLDKDLKLITEMKVFAEYLYKLKKKLFEQLKDLKAEEELNTDFVPY